MGYRSSQRLPEKPVVRDLILLGLIVGALPLMVFRPFFGLCAYAWLAFMRPQDMAWGITRSLPLSQWVGIALVVGLILSVCLGRERVATIKVQTVLMALLCGWIGLSVLTALAPHLSDHSFGLYWKSICLSILITGLVHDRFRLRAFLIVVAFCLGFLGAKFGIFGLLRGGARFHHGPGGFMTDNNSFALVLNMTLPLLVAIAMVEKKKILRYTAIGMAVLSLLTIVFTFSRGGFVTLALVAPLLVWRSKHRAAVMAVLAIGLCVLFYTSSGAFKEDYVERATSITDYEQDGSAKGRLNAWEAAWGVIQDYPVFGVGPNNFQVVYDRYSPAPGRFRVHHNAYLQIASESGVPALLLFLAAIGVTLWRLQRLRAYLGRTDRAELAWAGVYARMLQISVLAYCLGSMFLNTAYTELIYALIGLSVALEVVAHKQAESPETASIEEARDAEAELPWWKRPQPARPMPAPAGVAARSASGVSGIASRGGAA